MTVKRMLLCWLSLFCVLAVPVESQPAQLTNPGAAQMSACGLPPSHAQFTSASTITTFNLTADCTLSSSNVLNVGTWLRFDSGQFTINGNGHTITGPSNAHLIYTRNTGTVVDLNNAIIRQAGGSTSYAVVADSGSRVNVRNVIFRDSAAASTVSALDNGQLYLEDVQLLNNRRGTTNSNVGSAVSIRGGAFPSGFVSITDALFQGNTNSPNVIVVQGGTGNTGVLELHGCVIFRENVNDEGSPAQNYISLNNGTITDNSADSCSDAEAGFSYWLSLTPPPKKRKEKVPTAIPTPRPPAVTCPTLSAATGIAVRATYGLESGIQCQRIDGGGIGIQSIVEAGFIDAVDIWGYVDQGVEVCFPQAGRLLFLDARTSPRTVAPLESTVVNGMTCAPISTPGSIVLMPG